MDENNNNNNNNQQYTQQSQPQPQIIYDDPNAQPMTLKDWLITFLILMIPCAGFIMPFVWAFGNGNLNRKRYFQAYLIMMAIGVVLYIIFIILFTTVFAGFLAEWSDRMQEYANNMQV